MSDDDLYLIHHYLKTKSFDEILNWSIFERQFAKASMLVELEEKREIIKAIITLLGGKYE